MVGLRAQKALWGRAAGRCSIPTCRKFLFEDDENASDPTLIGENCHIVAESDNGPRADVLMPLEDRNGYANLILCCRNHHKIIDSQLSTYTVAELHRIKEEHEAWVRGNLGLDVVRLRDDELYAGYVERWEELAHIENWKAWTSWLLSGGQPSLAKSIDEDLSKLRGWLIGRIWPERYPLLEAAFANFYNVLQDLHEEFRSYATTERGTDELWTRKFYQIDEWNPERYAELSKRYDFHVDLICDLTLELTRAANLLCDRVRQFLSHSYRIAEGRLLVQWGPDENLAYHERPALYSNSERAEQLPYSGLEKFLEVRDTRDVGFGTGSLRP